MRNPEAGPGRPTFLKGLLGGVVAATLGTLSGSASASLLASVTVGAGSNSNSTQSTTAPVGLSISGTEENGTATALATATADFGTLGAMATASAAGGSAHPVIFGSATALYNDTIRVLSSDPTLTTASVTFEIALEGSCTTTDGATGGFVNAACGAQASMFGGPDLAIGVSWGGLLTNLVTLIVPVNVDLPIGAYLGVSGYANNGTFTGSFGSTLHSYIFSDLAGILITSESGHDYSLPGTSGGGTGGGTNTVPEPGTLSAMSLGFAGLILTRRRKRDGERSTR